jgi:hypothetical protein
LFLRQFLVQSGEGSSESQESADVDRKGHHVPGSLYHSRPSLKL